MTPLLPLVLIDPVKMQPHFLCQAIICLTYINFAKKSINLINMVFPQTIYKLIHTMLQLPRAKHTNMMHQSM